MKKSLLLAIVLTIFLIIFGLTGCNKEVALGPQKASIKTVTGRYLDFPSVAGTPQTTISQAREEVVSFANVYFQTAFLNLNDAKKSNYKQKILSHFTSDAKAKADKNWQILSLGDDSKKLGSIDKNSLQIPLIAINYDKAKKPSLSTLKIDFKAKYETNSKNADLKVEGWLVLAKEGQNWKIFDYKIKQNLQ